MQKIALLLIAISLLFPRIAMAAERDSINTYKWEPLPFAVKAGTSIVANVAITKSIKALVDETRPNGRDNNSMPSGHTAWAFTGASIAAHELYRYSGWWALGAHAVADGLGIQRTYSNNHYPKDVLAGAMVGVVATEIGYLVGDLIFPNSYQPLPTGITEDWLPGIDVTTTAILPFAGNSKNIEVNTGMAMSARLNVPMSEHWGLCVGPTFRSLEMSLSEIYQKQKAIVNAAGAFVGGVVRTALPWARWSIEGRAMPGFVKNFDTDLAPKWSFIFDATAGADCRLTNNFNVGCEVGYGFWHLQHNMSAITIGLYSRATF